MCHYLHYYAVSDAECLIIRNTYDVSNAECPTIYITYDVSDADGSAIRNANGGVQYPIMHSNCDVANVERPRMSGILGKRQRGEGGTN